MGIRPTDRSPDSPFGRGVVWVTGWGRRKRNDTRSDITKRGKRNGIEITANFVASFSRITNQPFSALFLFFLFFTYDEWKTFTLRKVEASAGSPHGNRPSAARRHLPLERRKAKKYTLAKRHFYFATVKRSELKSAWSSFY